jgi:2-amino-4-hydroxy-6-hydroxymethyldihydropteridine diphosphokinase
MTKVYASVGSNVEREQHISRALDALSATFGELDISPVYESVAVGFEGDNFYNLVVAFETGMDVGALSGCLRDIEAQNGRKRQGSKFSSRTLDLDILIYGEFAGEVGGVVLPRDEITRYAFVLRPLQDIAPDARHPLSGESYADLWQCSGFDEQELWPIDFVWDGRRISIAG